MELKISRTSGLRTFDLSSIQDAIARASTSIFNLHSRISLCMGLKIQKADTHVVRINLWMCTCTAFISPGGNILPDNCTAFFVDWWAGQDGRF